MLLSNRRIIILRPRWRKVLRDLWYDRSRTAIVVLSIAVGVFAVGMIFSTQVILSTDLSASYAATNPASAVLYVPSFDEELVQAVQRMDDVGEAEGRRTVSVRLKTRTDESQGGDVLWRTLKLDAIDDYNDIRLNRIIPEEGAWPPPKRSLLIERASLPLTGAAPSDTVVVETPDGRQRQLRIAGLVHDLSKPPAAFKGTPYGYVTFDTLEWLGFAQDFNELRILVAENKGNEDYIQTVADRVQKKIERSYFCIVFSRIVRIFRWMRYVALSIPIRPSAFGFGFHTFQNQKGLGFSKRSWPVGPFHQNLWNFSKTIS